LPGWQHSSLATSGPTAKTSTAGTIRGSGGTVAVNLSPIQFSRDELAETIHAILLETGLSPKRLELEVTESTLTSDQTRGLHILRRLKSMGISVVMDDFGTGYSMASRYA
jgi:EAL domain-containing protein (putative c-di-GMP-specific phosphodiesterase class I)